MSILNDLLTPKKEEQAQTILVQRRLWKCTDRLNEAPDPLSGDPVPPGSAGAWVLGKGPEPFRVLWNPNNWSCECPDTEFCAHLAALLLYLEDLRPGRFSDTPETETTETAEEELDPELDPLFFAETGPAEPLFLLGPEHEVTQTLNRKVLRKKSSEISVRLKAMNRQPWTLVRTGADFRAGQQEGVQAVLDALESDHPPKNPTGQFWIHREYSSVKLRFELQTDAKQPLYRPVTELTGGHRSLSGTAFAAGKSLLVLNPETAESGVTDCADLWFLRLILSRKLLSVSDLRSRFSQPVPVDVDLPPLPGELETLKPVLVLEAFSRGQQTDLVPQWRYGDVLTGPENQNTLITDPRTKRPLGIRDRDAEQKALSQAEGILSDDLRWQRGYYSTMTGDSAMPVQLEKTLADVLSEYGQLLLESGVEIRLEDRPLRAGGGLRIQAEQSGSLLELSAAPEGDFGQFDLDDWLERGGLARTRDAYFVLTDKALGQLNFLRKHGMDSRGFLSTSPENLSLIDAVYADIQASEDTVNVLELKRAALRRLANFKPEDFPPPPPDFQARLRPYQTLGYAWLLSLNQNQLGGCLADDMGLGKTIQTLAYLSRLKHEGRLGLSLLVGPVVTLGNWDAEIRKFAPFLRAHHYSGPASKRYLPEVSGSADLVIVSYQTLRNDAERFLEREWDHIILDEAHYVKNASSRTFKAVRSLRSGHRISLTGTPLENHLNELWSQMSFLNPGLLGTQNSFRKHFGRTVEDERLKALADTVSPFILRRRKEEVLEDLPSKTEIVIRCEMTADQAEAYNSMRQLYYRQVTGMLAEGASRVEIFTILSKLRLLAIHPPLAGEQFAGVSSGKMTVMKNLLDEIYEEDHKTLVFSQFLGTLDEAEKICRRRNREFSRLTGATKNREEEIDRFRNDPENRIFLLSLKAGGVGINLTAADYVILLDPWWNPAVEAQAVDRAHRMGQTKPVMAYRLITKDTIEEKVLELQKQKKQLVAGVLDGGAPDLNGEEILELMR